MERHNITIYWNNGEETTTVIKGTREQISNYFDTATYIRGFYDDDEYWIEYKVRARAIYYND